jgi:threonine/homoserine/homoserine lactone efflux protein
LLDSVIKAIIAGFVLSVMIGPVFFLLLETSIRRGVRAALAFDCGVFLSDIIYILLAYVFYNEVANLLDGDNSYMIQLIGGIIFVIFGLMQLLKKPEAMSKEDTEGINQTKDYLMLGLKGFLLNFANPAVIVYWFSVIAFGAKKLENGEKGSGDYMWLYITVLIITFFSIDILKILGAKKLRPFITDRVLTGLNRLTGLIILISGIVLFARGIAKFL